MLSTSFNYNLSPIPILAPIIVKNNTSIVKKERPPSSIKIHITILPKIVILVERLITVNHVTQTALVASKRESLKPKLLPLADAMEELIIQYLLK